MTKDSNLKTLLERAVVKVLVGDTFKGTGFFITPDYLLTAYHCFEDFIDENTLFIKSTVYGKLQVSLEKDRSFRNREIDIAVLKLVRPIEVSDYLPVGLLTESQATDDILAVGYPAEIFSVISGEIHGFSEQYPHKFFNNAMKAEGQSGGPIYHLATRRVVGLALSVYKPDVMTDGGLAGRFEILFEQWPELQALNQQAVERWERRFKEGEMVKLPHFSLSLLSLPSRWWYYGIAGIILLIMLIFIVMGLNSQKTEGNCSPAISGVQGNISLDCSK